MTVRRLLDSVLFNVEERGWWVSGRLKEDPSLFVEFSFEDALRIPATYWIGKTVPIVYFGLHSRRRMEAEFLVPRWTQRPRNEELTMHIAQVLYPLRNFRPIFIVPSVDPPSTSH